LEAAFILLEFPSPLRRIFIGSHSLPPLWFAVSVLHLVLRRIQNMEGLHKLSSPWEGAFSIAKVTGPGSYRLQTLEGDSVSNSWNIDQLCRFYM
jgi:hypothetical protein